MSRKMLALLMTMMLAFSLAACGGGKKEAPAAPETEAATEAAETVTETEAAETETEAATEAVTEAPAESEPAETEAEAIPEEENGTYYEMTLLEDGELSVDAATLHAMNAGYILLRDDGTGCIVMMGEDPEEFTWDEQNITVDDDQIPYTLDGDVLHLEKDDAVMEFTKTTWEELNAAPEPVKAADGYDPDHREGYYKLATIEVEGQVIDAAIIEAGGVHIYMVLQADGTGELVTDSDDPEKTALEWDNDKITVEGEETSYIYLDGVISLEAGGASMNFVYAGTVDEAP